MQGTAITQGLGSEATGYTPSKQPTAEQTCRTELARMDRSVLLMRCAIAFMVVTLILVPGGFRALLHAGMGWEAWWFSRVIVVGVIGAHVLCCWAPLALRYFRPGECRDVAAFIISTTTLFLQALICHGLFENYAVWYGGGA